MQKLLYSLLLQTDIRVLYELLYVLNNSFRQQKSFRALKQVEQCINRLKEMKLDSALGELMELCPSQAQRQLASDSKGDIIVPSQPALEWYCLKVLGAAKLMSCVLKRCTRAFLLSQQHLQSEEFVLLNVVLNSMLSRLWVFFRGILACLAPLYEQILKLWKDVSEAQRMPYLRDFSLPTDIAEFLGPSDSPLLGMEPVPAPAPENLMEGVEMLFTQDESEQRKLAQAGLVNIKNKNVDLGTAVVHQRKSVKGIDLKALLKKTHGDLPETSLKQREQSSSHDTFVLGHKRMFLKKVKTLTTFSDMATEVKEMVRWCESMMLTEEKKRLSFLYLKCKRMEQVESAGYSVQRKLKSFRQEVYWALLLLRSIPRTSLSLTSLWRSAHCRTLYQPLRTRFTSITTGSCKRRFLHVQRKTMVLSCEKDPLVRLEEDCLHQSDTNVDNKSPESTVQESSSKQENDIDNIFASIGF